MSKFLLYVPQSLATGSLLGLDAEATRIESFISELTKHGGGNCLTPDILSEWIRAKGDDFGSVYLVPASATAASTSDQSSLLTTLTSGSAAAAAATASYRYSLTVSQHAQQQQRFMTLRYYTMCNSSIHVDSRVVLLSKNLSVSG